jgi:hypothetical protein
MKDEPKPDEIRVCFYDHQWLPLRPQRSRSAVYRICACVRKARNWLRLATHRGEPS